MRDDQWNWPDRVTEQEKNMGLASASAGPNQIASNQNIFNCGLDYIIALSDKQSVVGVIAW